MGEDDIVLTVRARHFSRHPGSRRAVGPSSPSAPRDSLQFTCAEHKYPPHRTQFGHIQSHSASFGHIWSHLVTVEAQLAGDTEVALSWYETLLAFERSGGDFGDGDGDQDTGSQGSLEE
eukprot:112740-Prorocentrum_minimum.AAC.1